MPTKLFFATGPHNMGYYVAFVVWIGSLSMATGQFCSSEEFTVLARSTECEQPLNNRCSNHFRIRDSGGLERAFEGLTAFRARESDLAVGNSIQKHRFHFDYLVNGQQATWSELPGVVVASILALVPFGLARFFTPKRST